MWAVVPARWASSRLPGKVLADIGGVPMVQRVWQAACAAEGVDHVVVATDDPRVADVARAFGADVRITGEADSGTQRAARVAPSEVAVVVVQADLPFLEPTAVAQVTESLAKAPVATLSAPLQGGAEDPAIVKVVARGGWAVDFSRHPIPAGGPYQQHVGIYGFAPGMLARCGSMPRSARAQSEDLEQLTWLDAGVRMWVGDLAVAPLSVDTPGQLLAARSRQT